jgi:hypothetical protein
MKIIVVAAKVGFTVTQAGGTHPLYQVDPDKQPLDAAKYRDALRLPRQLPANAFWYVMVYEPRCCKHEATPTVA